MAPGWIYAISAQFDLAPKIKVGRTGGDTPSWRAFVVLCNWHWTNPRGLWAARSSHMSRDERLVHKLLEEHRHSVPILFDRTDYYSSGDGPSIRVVRPGREIFSCDIDQALNAIREVTANEAMPFPDFLTEAVSGDPWLRKRYARLFPDYEWSLKVRRLKELEAAASKPKAEPAEPPPKTDIAWFIVRTPEFCATVELNEYGLVTKASPVVDWLKGWEQSEVFLYSHRKGWSLTIFRLDGSSSNVKFEWKEGHDNA